MEVYGLIFLGLFFGAAWLISKIIGVGQPNWSNQPNTDYGTDVPTITAKQLDAEGPLDDMLEPPIFDVMNLDTWQTNDVVAGRNYLD